VGAGLRAPAGPGPRAVLDALPVIPRDPRAARALPRVVMEALERMTSRSYVDTIGRLRSGPVSFFVVPVRGARPCRDVAPAAFPLFQGDGACLFAVRDETLLMTHCRTVAAIRGGRMAERAVKGHSVVLGFAPRGAGGQSRPMITLGGGQVLLRSRGGVYAEYVSNAARVEDFPRGIPPIRTVRPAPAPSVHVVGTGAKPPKLAHVVRRIALAGVKGVDLVGEGGERRPSRVSYTDQGAERRARVIAARVGITRVERRAADGYEGILVEVGDDYSVGRETP
jgi:hypothetical protein